MLHYAAGKGPHSFALKGETATAAALAVAAKPCRAVPSGVSLSFGLGSLSWSWLPRLSLKRTVALGVRAPGEHREPERMICPSASKRFEVCFVSSCCWAIFSSLVAAGLALSLTVDETGLHLALA